MKQPDIHRFVRMNQVDDLRLAIRNGAAINETDEYGRTALHHAVAYKNKEAILFLTESGADVTVQDQIGATALHYSIEYKLIWVAEALLVREPKLVSIGDHYGNQPLWTATFGTRDNDEIVSLLLRYGADPGHRNMVGLTPIDIAIRRGQDELRRILEASKHESAP